ncbi:MAG: 16S rRNA (uracil(1498)-N(3))-methyltransferase [Bacteriovoracaceae bacterium]|nr:16S rRNA (uracil(1498)-N(3))-methyltransferase [Bacteriovoracaceae bacterium]
MRAIFLESMENLGPGLSTCLEGDRAKHLIKSIRINEGEELLLMDGKGTVAKATVTEILKKQVVLTIASTRFVPKEKEIDLLICLPKKDAFEEIVRGAVEMGISKIIPAYSEFSQGKFKPSERYDRIIESGIIQSNNAHGPILSAAIDLTDLENISSFYDKIIYFSSRKGDALSLSGDEKKILLIIGPEGGLSEEEEKILAEHKKAETIHIPCPIMRAPTAFNVGVGYLHGTLQALKP